MTHGHGSAPPALIPDMCRLCPCTVHAKLDASADPWSGGGSADLSGGTLVIDRRRIRSRRSGRFNCDELDPVIGARLISGGVLRGLPRLNLELAIFVGTGLHSRHLDYQ